MKHRIIALTTVALLSACGEAPAPTQPNAVALVQGFSNPTAAIAAAASTAVPYTTVGASTFTVPAGVTSLTVVAVGGGGGGSIPHAGGSGALVTTTLPVTPGQVLDLFVGANSGPGTNWSVGGGGGSSISASGVPLAVAGGGGGAGRDRDGGSAGGPSGAGGDGVSGGTVSCGKRCSTTGTGGIGGAGGIGGHGGSSTGGWAMGGNGGDGFVSTNGGGNGYYGGGGGGGFGGGGGGGSGSGGGGGGSLGPAGTTYAPANNGGPVGAPGGNGSIEITFVAAPTDNTPPSIASIVTGTLGNNGWYTSNVDVSWTVTDAESAVSSSSGCDATSVTADTHGVTFTCTATSAGGTDSKSVTIQRDATAPTIGYTGNAGSYTVDQTVAITCSASDAMSGLASSTCANVGGSAYDFAIGSNSFSASAQDNAGNGNTASTSFTVVADAGSVCALVQRWVSNAGVANSMCVKLRQGSYGAFRNELSAQSGKKISDANAAILLRLVNLLG